MCNRDFFSIRTGELNISFGHLKRFSKLESFKILKISLKNLQLRIVARGGDNVPK